MAFSIDSFQGFTDSLLGVDKKSSVGNQLSALVARTRKGKICSNRADKYYIRMIQAALKQLGHGQILQPYGVDGDYGPKTQQAVRAFQGRNDLPQTGCVNTPTAQKMAAMISQKSTGFVDELLNLGSQYLSYKAYEELPDDFKAATASGQTPSGGGTPAPMIQPQQQSISTKTILIGSGIALLAVYMLSSK